MISSKGIVVLCYILTGFVFTAAIVLFFVGIVQLADKSAIGGLLIAISLVLPLVVSISLYPIFALANIDVNVASINEKIDRITKNSKEITQEKQNDPPKTDLSHNFFTPAPKREEAKEDNNLFKYAEAIDYVNKRYGISIFSKDDIDTIKEKVASIDGGGFSALILKRKVEEATSIDEIINVFVMHKVAND